MQPFDSPTEAAFRAKARSWLASHAEPLPIDRVAPSAIIAEWTPEEEEEKLAEAQEWQRLKFDAGWAGISWPRTVGGRGGSVMEDLIFRDEEATFDVPHDALGVGIGWCGPAVLQHGSTDQHARLLPDLLRGDEIWCQLFSEPGAGSDLAGLKTRATRDGDEWVLNGQKTWTTFAQHSDWGLCVARHDADLPKHRGLSAFIVDMASPGIEVRPVKQMTGSQNFNEVFLSDVRVSDEDRIGDVGEGWGVVITTFLWERVNLLAGGERILGGLQEFIKARGREAAPEIRDRFIDLYIRAETIRFSTMRLLTAVSQGGLPGPEGSTLKLAATATLSDIYELALDVMGPEAMLAADVAPGGGEWHAGFLGMPGLRVGGGTDQIQRNIIGDRVLGLPPDIRVDKDLPFREVPG
ncbi:MAG: acyl-CoA dehydrogenase family protein [Acidimicrobiia bacterium]|nr:acyl-CoA dehydrogenase family protein [Acidimicrobiia bacterium]NNK92156.1 acyl-CoA dehydrogenase [Acidimicrobiia bacterium]